MSEFFSIYDELIPQNLRHPWKLYGTKRYHFATEASSVHDAVITENSAKLFRTTSKQL